MKAALESTRGIPALGPARWAAFAEVARGLPSSEAQTEVLGTVIHRDFLLPLAMACTMGCALTVLGVFFPGLGLLVLLAILSGVCVDAFGGNSWVRRMTPLSIGRSILSWPTGGQELADNRPTTLICLDAGRPVGRASQLMLAYTVAGLLVALVGTFIHWVSPDIPLPTQRWGAVVLAAGPLLAALLSPLTRRSCFLASSSKVAADLGTRLQADPPCSTRVALAILDHSALHADALTTLLTCHRHRLPPGTTTVVCWIRGPDALTVTAPRRGIKSAPLSPRMQQLVESLSLPVESGLTSATAARRMGHVTVGLRGGANPTEVGEKLMEMVSELDRQAEPQAC